ncbi:MAG: heavy-metal-associated domain-containing protein [Chloroflexi bacterium]|nr:heavy-metal-associated domain-containing protein [Chloroflexota bacterium]
MQTEKYLVPGVSCQHCVRAVTAEVSKLAGVSAVQVDLASKVVTVEHEAGVSPAAIVAAIKEAGYEEVSPAP